MKIRIKRNNKEVIKEAAMGVNQLPDNYYIEIFKRPGYIAVSYNVRDDDDYLGLEGEVTATSLGNSCIPDTFGISHAAVTIAGWGPMLYDVLMEALTEDNISLTSDRKSVSALAWNVWEYYLKKRSSELELIRMDVSRETMVNYYGPDESQWPFTHLTKSENDDCMQNASLEWAAGEGDWTSVGDSTRKRNVQISYEKAAKWHEQPTSYAYKFKNKELPTISYLDINSQIEYT
jgi:hypothetical protein